MYHVSGESRDELIPRNLKEKTTCSPKTCTHHNFTESFTTDYLFLKCNTINHLFPAGQGSKMLGWQLCTDVTYPVLLMGRGFPPPGPIIFGLRLQKLDRALQKYLLEAAYALVPPVGISACFC